MTYIISCKEKHLPNINQLQELQLVSHNHTETHIITKTKFQKID